MRKITLFIALILSSVLTYAQSSNVRKAESALETGDIQTAMKLIDEASKHEKTFDDGKTWYVRGTVYQAAVKENYEDGLLKEAAASFKKVQELEKEGSNYHTLSDLKIQEIWGGFINVGSEAYGAANFEDAVTAFEKALLVLPEDTTATLYAGISAQQAKDNQTALKYYYRLIDLGYQAEDIYGSIISIERYDNDDIDKALEVLEMAKAEFPENDAFEKQEINLLISAERVDEAKDKIMAAITKEPNNANLYFNLGYMYDELNQPEEAEKAYLKALEIDPEYLDANFNYAVYNFNKAVEILKVSNNMDLTTYQKKGKQMENEAREYFRKSMPYFEKCLEQLPKNLDVLESLQVVYSRLKMNDKALEMADKIDAVKAEGTAGEE